MEDNIFDKVHEVDLKKTMETSYIDYAMSVIAARALPDVRDGLKPVSYTHLDVYKRQLLYNLWKTTKYRVDKIFFIHKKPYLSTF